VIGGRNPAHATAIGKALLAWTHPDDAHVADWIAAHAPLAARTPNTITDPDRLAAALTQVRERGWASEFEESEPGVRCLAVPVFLGRAQPAAAISLAAPKERLSDRQAREIAPALREIAGGGFG
jgi:IclR family acetate operon transcriptional repressor